MLIKSKRILCQRPGLWRSALMMRRCAKSFCANGSHSPPSLPHRCVFALFVCQCVCYSPLLERIRKVKSEAAKCWIVGHWEINHLIKVGLDTKAKGQCWVSSVAIWHCQFVMRTSNLRVGILTWMSVNDIHCHLAQRWQQRLQIDYQVIRMDWKNYKWVVKVLKVVNKWERRRGQKCGKHEVFNRVQIAGIVNKL